MNTVPGGNTSGSPEDAQPQQPRSTTKPQTRTRPATKRELEEYIHREQGELERLRLNYETGWLGRIAGSPRNAPTNLAVLTVILTFAAGFIAFALPTNLLEFWKVISPILTLTLGYAFGRSSTPRKGTPP